MNKDYPAPSLKELWEREAIERPQNADQVKLKQIFTDNQISEFQKRQRDFYNQTNH